MASELKSFPKIPANIWWTLRKKFHSSLPREVSKEYLATALDLSVDSARVYMGQLKNLGLVGDDNKPTERANKWRGDQEDYSEACHEILNEIYPHELNDAVDGTRGEKDKVKKWFMSRLKIGEKAANDMAAMYVLIREADLSKEVENSNSSKPKSDPKPRVATARHTPKATQVQPASIIKQQEQTYIESQSSNHNGFQPKIHIDVQIHISPESTAEQIDQIFASMGKHLSGVKS